MIARTDTAAPARPLISLIVPTRMRVEKLRQFLDSLAATTAQPARVEVILVADADDAQTLVFRHDAMPFKLIVVPPGGTMGALNRAGYAASAGDFIMLVNDDVIVRTSGWDEKILGAFRAFPDGVVLAHVNDMIFGEQLCTFPFVTRTYCELAGTICPEEYSRYRIDDHIYNVFNLLAVLGRKRIVYLPDIVFEHTNVGAGAGVDRYVPAPGIHDADTQHFDRLLGDRKKLAIKLAAHIDRHRFGQLADTRRKLLAPIADSVALRKPEFVTVRPDAAALSSLNTRVTIGVVSADIRNPHAQACLRAIKQHTANYDLIVLDNNFGPDFNHPREMNRILSICRTDFLVLMDDDVFVNPGWLDNLLKCMTPQAGVVTPMHMDREGELSYAGVVMRPDYTGNHAHSVLIPPEPEPVQTVCSAIMLIDMTKCGHIRVDESYSKYFLDIDYGLRVWESGFQAIVSPFSLVTHVGGATMQRQEDGAVDVLFEAQREHYVREWIANGRYRRLERNVWSKVAAISTVQTRLGGAKARKVRRRGGAAGDVPPRAGVAEASVDGMDTEIVPILYYMTHKVVRYLGRFWALPQALGHINLEDEADRRRTGVIVGKTLSEVMIALDRHGDKDEIVQVQEGYKGHNIVRYLGRVWGVPQVLGQVNLADEAARNRPGVIVADTPAGVREAIDRTGPRDEIVLVQEAYKSHNIVRYRGRFWGLPVALGHVNLEDESDRQQPGVIVRSALADVMTAIDLTAPQDEIVVVQEGYRAHNIVHFRGRFWGLPQALGKVDLKDDTFRQGPQVIVAETFPAVRQAIERAGRRDEITQVQEGYKGYNIVRYLGQVWGLPQALGPVNLRDQAQRTGAGIIVADTLAEVRAAIDRAGSRDEIVQVQEGYKAHNIVRYLGRYWGLPQALGQVNLRIKAGQRRPGIIVADTLAEVREAIDCVGPDDQIVQVQEGYKAHNILRYFGRFWGVPQALGPVRFEDETERQRPGVLVAGTLAEIRDAIDSAGPENEIVQVHEGYKGYNIVRYLGRFWGVPQVLGPVRLEDEAERQRPGIIVANSPPELRIAIADAQYKRPPNGGADSRRWIDLSPATDVGQSHGGYRVYRYEYKFFGIPETHTEFSYDDFLAGKYGDGVLIAHSYTELKAAIGRLQQSGAGSRSVLLAPFPADSSGHAVTLIAADYPGEPAAGNVIRLDAPDLFRWARGAREEDVVRLKESLRGQGVGRAAIPWRFPESWADNSLEALASRLVDVIDVMQPGGSLRTYEGEAIHRLIYNKAYLCGMFTVVPQPAGKQVLEVGCSDGLVCDIFAQLGAAHVTGVDVMRSAGCGFRSPRITYRTMDAGRLEFPDQSFDICYSIATFEHLPDPWRALQEMLRVTRVGGYCYVQAAPFYHTPFGHHMFAYFQDYPWIHLRKTQAEIVSYMQQRGIDRQVEADHAISCASYVAEMLTRDHVNGLFLHDFRLDEFAARADVQVLRRNTTFEGRELLTPEILAEIPGIDPERLVEHGFEFAFRRLA